MGTRNLTMVMHDGKYKLAQYGQWDGYPAGQGKTVLAFARRNLATKRGRERFIAQLERVRLVTREEHEALWAPFVKDDGTAPTGFVTMEQAEKFNAAHPYFTRDHGAGILDLVFKADGEVLTKDETSFAADSLMCEWAYVLDLDKLTLEVFKGFNTKQLDPSERFASLPREAPTHREAKYWPVRCVRAWKLDDLPSFATFCAECDPPEAEEDAA